MPTIALMAVARRDTRSESPRAVTLDSVIRLGRRRTDSGSVLLLDPRQRPVYQEGQGEEDHGERDGDVEVTLRRLQHGRRRQHPRLTSDVPANHQGGPDLGDDGAEAGHAGGQEGEPGLTEENPE